jgi:hypothetical protein
MSDLTDLSDADLLAQFKAAQQAQNQAAMSHSGPAPAPSGFLLNDPSQSGGSTLQVQPGAILGIPGKFDTGIPTPQWLDQGLSGAGRGLIHTERSVGNLAGLVPDSVLAEEKQTDAPLMNTTAGKWGNLAGESAITAPLGVGAIGATGKLVKALATNPITNAAIQGGIQGAATSDPGERGINTMTGAITGGAAGAGSSAVGKLVNGLTRTPEAQLLLNEGVSLTPGQLNPGGVINQTEQAAEHAPVLGPLVKGAQDNAEQGFQRAVIQRAAAPGATVKPSENVHEMLQQAYDSYEPLYAQAKGFPAKAAVINGAQQPTSLQSLFNQAAKTPGTTDAGQKAAQSFLNNELTRLPKNPTSTDLLALRSNIRTAARSAKLSNDTIAGDKAAIFSQADQHVTNALNSQLPPDALAALQSADSKYGTYKIVENAVAASKDNVAGLTPQKLSQAVFNATNDPQYARGAGGPLRDLAQAGTKTFQTVVPPNGATLGTLAGMGIGAYAHPAVAAGLGGAQAALTLSPTGRAIASGQTAPQQATQRLVAALQNKVPEPFRNVGSQLALRGATGAGMPVTQQYLPQALAAALMMAPPSAQSH